jgi:hypothetical protein
MGGVKRGRTELQSVSGNEVRLGFGEKDGIALAFAVAALLNGQSWILNGFAGLLDLLVHRQKLLFPLAGPLGQCVRPR